MENKQTAISLLEKRLKAVYEKEGKLPLAYTLHIIGQAKELEKEQIMKAWEDRVTKLPEPKGHVIDFTPAEEYYNQTYER